MFFCNSTDLNNSLSLCKFDIFNFLAHSIFSCIFLLGICYLIWKNWNKRLGEAWRPISHTSRYICSVALIYVHTLELVEGIIADLEFPGVQLHLHLNSSLSIISVILSLIFYDQIEVKKSRSFLVFLLLYWPSTSALNTLRVIEILRLGLTAKHVRCFLVFAATVLRYYASVWEVFLLFKEKYICCRYKRGKSFFERIKGHEHYHANFLSRITWNWLTPLLAGGFNKKLDLDDLGEFYPAEQSEPNSKVMYDEMMKEKYQNHGKFSLWKLIIRCHGRNFALSGLCKLTADMLLFFGPFVLDRVVIHAGLYFENKQFLGNYSTHYTISFYKNYSELYSNASDFVNAYETPKQPVYLTWDVMMKNGFFLAVMALGVQLIQNILWQNHFFLAIREGIRCKGSLQGLIYQKSLRLTLYSMNDDEFSGKILNHMSLDAYHMYFLFYLGNCAWTVPVQVAVTIYFLYRQLGVAAIIGAIFLILILPMQVAVGGVMSKFQKKAMQFTDKRIKQCNELLQSIKLLKLYAWELVFRDNLNATRNKELRMILKAACMRAVSLVLTESAPILAIMVTFLLYSKMSGEFLTANKVFSGVALFNLLLIPLVVVTMIVGAISHAKVSCKRINDFLEMNEVEKAITDFSDGEHQATAVQVVDGNYSWKVSIEDDNEEIEKHLSDINLTIPEGSLTIVAGSIGSGKSSLLSAILGEMTTITGSVKWRKGAKVAYGSQKAWLMNATLKDNIIFGQPYDEAKYRKVIECSALKPDIEMLPAGDQTEIGERGINVSGGQKQRISIARTLYSNSDIILFDDPMSALDVHVGKHIFEEAIYKYLIKELGRTVILVTHQMQYLPKADGIIGMSKGKIVARGTYEELSENHPELIASWEKGSSEKEEKKSIDKRRSLTGSESDLVWSSKFAQSVSRSGSIATLHLVGNDLDNSDDIVEGSKKSKVMTRGKKTDDEAGKLINEEEREEGAVSLNVYKQFFLAAGIPFSFCTLMAYLIRQSLRIGSDYWLAHWTEEAKGKTPDLHNMTLEEYHQKEVSNLMLVYGLICTGFVLFCMACGFLIEFSCLKAAKFLHTSMLWRIADAPMRFFDTTPLGRIVNRFTGDMMIVDERLAQILDSFLYCTFFSLGGLVVIASSSFYFLIAIVPLAVVYIAVQRFYIASCRDLQRLDSLTKSPVLSHFGETLGGLATIRAYERQDSFEEKNFEVVDMNNKAFLNLQTAILWMGIRLDFVGSFTVFAATVCSLVTALNGDITEGVVGLCITYSLMISANLNWMMKSMSETEMYFNAVERICHYTTIKSEPFDEGISSADNWPEKGTVNISNLSLRYDESLDDVIQNLDLNISGGDKVGICGRTGSGKSSLMLGLFRLIDTSNGKIQIDGVDISRVPLRQLRSRLSIIPQDPVMFAGSVRYNLDPARKYADQQIWKALEIAQLSPTIQKEGKGLDLTVSEGGENFSLGQRQLFCLARALLRNSNILIMDEATASVDMITDKIVQEVIKHHFSDKTILTIAHRVASILNYDTIVVLQNGSVLETGSPDDLKIKEGGAFSGMIRDNL